MNTIVKVGSTSLYNGGPRLEVFDSIADQVSELMNQGNSVGIVSSGAIAFGKGDLNIPSDKSLELSQEQVMAGIGQPLLMDQWSKAFGLRSVKATQVLVTNEVLLGRVPEQRGTLADTLKTTESIGHIVPIINENDAIATEEIVQGDNDRLSAHVANLVGARVLYLLGTSEAIYECPKTKAGRIESADLGDFASLQLISEDTADPQGTGGMLTKLEAAKIFLEADNDRNDKFVFVAGAAIPEVLHNASLGAVGTRLTASAA